MPDQQSQFQSNTSVPWRDAHDVLLIAFHEYLRTHDAPEQLVAQIGRTYDAMRERVVTEGHHLTDDEIVARAWDRANGRMATADAGLTHAHVKAERMEDAARAEVANADAALAIAHPIRTWWRNRR